MNSRKIKIYLASGWFTSSTREILDKVESLLDSRDDVELYSPRRDGIMLTPNQRHDTAVRESVFNDNISHITSADLVVANIYSGDGYNDPGTMYEIGYAMANNVPVVGFTTTLDNVSERFKGISSGFEYIVQGYENLSACLDDYDILESKPLSKDKVLFVGAGNDDIDKKLVSYIMDNGADVRWINEFHPEIYAKIDEVFRDVDYMIAVVDDRKTLVSWMIGQAYARHIPVITYSDFNYGINVMLLVSVLTHIRGTDELVKFLQQVKREGLESIPPFDISQLDSM